MKSLSRLIILATMLTLGACGADEHDHPHDGEDHAHEESAGAHPHDGDEAHAHDDDHAHEAPSTEAFYGDEAEAETGLEPVAVEADDEEDGGETADVHTHEDGEPHTHDH